MSKESLDLLFPKKDSSDLGKTRIGRCVAYACKFNIINIEPALGVVDCSLKLVFVVRDGKCEQYEANNSDHD